MSRLTVRMHFLSPIFIYIIIILIPKCTGLPTERSKLDRFLILFSAIIHNCTYIATLNCGSENNYLYVNFKGFFKLQAFARISHYVSIFILKGR
jgi:hypothetical protein